MPATAVKHGDDPLRYCIGNYNPVQEGLTNNSLISCRVGDVLATPVIPADLREVVVRENFILGVCREHRLRFFVLIGVESEKMRSMIGKQLK